MSKQFWGVIVGIILIFVGIFALSGGGNDNSMKTGGKSSALTQHTQGAGSGGVTLVEYGDYQCPYCQQYYPTVKQVEDKYGDQLKFQFRNFPLTSLHRNAFAAARAAEAADLQGKFWEMHDLLYANNDPTGQSGWVASSEPNAYFEQYAKQIGLNVAQFKTDFASSTVNDRVNADLTEGNRLKITGTPTFYLNGNKIEPTNSIDSFAKFIDPALAQKTQTGAGSSAQ